MSDLTSTARAFLGPIMIAGILNSFVYGLALLQVIQYIWGRQKDPLLMRLLVYWLCAFDTAHTAALVYALYRYGVTHFTDPDALSALLWPLAATPLFTTATALPVQQLFAWRIRASMRSWAAYVVIAGLSVATATLAIATAACNLNQPTVQEVRNHTALGDTWITVALVTDTAIAILLFMHLTSSDGIAHSGGMAERIIRASAETTGYAACFCIAHLIFFTISRGTNLHLVFAVPMGRLYSAALMASLNARSTLRDELIGTGLAFHSNRLDLAAMPAAVTIAVEQEIQLDEADPFPRARGKKGLRELQRSGFI